MRLTTRIFLAAIIGFAIGFFGVKAFAAQPFQNQYYYDSDGSAVMLTADECVLDGEQIDFLSKAYVTTPSVQRTVLDACWGIKKDTPTTVTILVRLEDGIYELNIPVYKFTPIRQALK